MRISHNDNESFPPETATENLFVVAEHFIFLDEAFGLLRNPFEIVFLAQRQFVLAHIDRSFLTTFTTFHKIPIFINTMDTKDSKEKLCVLPV